MRFNQVAPVLIGEGFPTLGEATVRPHYNDGSQPSTDIGAAISTLWAQDVSNMVSYINALSDSSVVIPRDIRVNKSPKDSHNSPPSSQEKRKHDVSDEARVDEPTLKRVRHREDNLVNDLFLDVDTLYSLPRASTTSNDDGGDSEDDILVIARKSIPASSSHRLPVTSLAYSPNGLLLASGSEDTICLVWNVADQRVFLSLEHSEKSVSALAFSSDNATLASASQDGKVILWCTLEWLEYMELATETPAQTLAYSSDGTLLIAGTRDGTLAIWDIEEDYTPLPPMKYHDAAIIFMKFSSDGSTMVTGGLECDCVVWDVPSLRTTEPRMRKIGDGRVIFAAALSPNGDRVITAFEDGSYTIWSAESGEALHSICEHDAQVSAIEFSPDGQLVVSGAEDGSVRVVDSCTGLRRLSLGGSGYMITTALFSPNGRFVCAGGEDRATHIWRVDDGEAVLTCRDHNADLTHVLFSPDGRMLASAALDGTVHIRSIASITAPDY